MNGDITFRPNTGSSLLYGGVISSAASGELLEGNDLAALSFDIFSGAYEQDWNGTLTLTDYAGGWAGPLPETPDYEEVHLADFVIPASDTSR